MQPDSRMPVLSCLAVLAVTCKVIANEPPLNVQDVQEVRAVLPVLDYDRRQMEQWRHLIRMGEKVFPIYEKILSDPNVSPREIVGVFNLLRSVEADRRRFVKHALSRLTHPQARVRRMALDLLDRIGTSAEASPVIALLSDEDTTNVYVAARSLATIGGSNEVVAMDVWLRGVSHRDNKRLRDQVHKCRDELKKRLDDASDPRKQAQQLQQQWKELCDTKPVTVQRAVWNLTAGESRTVVYLTERLHPAPAAAQKHFEELLADLDSESFDRREAATRESSRGAIAESVFRKALDQARSLELRRRLARILDELPNWRTKNPELLRQVRAVWVLQQIGTPEAKALLEKLAAGAPSARLTQKAKDALESLKKR